MTTFQNAARELAAVGDAIEAASIETACQMIAAAGKIALYGCGRESLQLQGFAMRLYHLDCDVAMQGAMNTPHLGPSDLFIASAGPGELSTVAALITVAKRAGAQVLFLTAEPTTATAQHSDHVLHIPAQTMASDLGQAKTSTLPMGSLYEGALFLLFEIMVLRLATLLNRTPDTMRARHTNLE